MSAPDRLYGMPFGDLLDFPPAVTPVETVEMLRVAARHVGVLGGQDRAVVAWLAGHAHRDPVASSTIATVASLLRRAWAAGVEAGRAELAGESAAVARLRAELASLARRLPEVDVCGVDGYVCQGCGVRYGGRVFDCPTAEIDWSRRVSTGRDGTTGGAR